MAVTRLFTPRPYDSFDPAIAGVAPILATGTDVDNTKLAAVQAAAVAAGLGTLPTSAGGTAPTPVSEPLRFRGAWQANTVYSYGDVVSQAGILYVAPMSFTSGGSFVAGNWTQLGLFDATSLNAASDPLGSAGQVQAEVLSHALRRDNPHGTLFNQLPDAPMATPEDHGFLGWTFDPKDCSATASLSAGTIFLVRARLRKESAITSVITNYSSGASVTGAYVGVYTLAAGTYTLEGTSSESHAAVVTGGDQTIALTAPTRVLPAGQVIYIALLNTGAASSVPTAGSTFRNSIGLTTTTGFRFATFGAGKSTLDATIPAASASSNNNNIFAAVL